ncbi:MAG: hypothetical protein ACRDTA_02910 [Pseudonocardiaceae bacterium]
MIETRELTKDCATQKLTEQFQRDVFVRSPRRSGLTRVLTGMGATVLAEPDGGLSVTGMDAWRIASAAAAHYIPIQELTPRSASLDDSHHSTLTPPARRRDWPGLRKVSGGQASWCCWASRVCRVRCLAGS